MQISHQNLANIFFSDHALFFCPDLFYHVIKQESGISIFQAWPAILESYSQALLSHSVTLGT